jgi:hypothetical protein
VSHWGSTCRSIGMDKAAHTLHVPHAALRLVLVCVPRWPMTPMHARGWFGAWPFSRHATDGSARAPWHRGLIRWRLCFRALVAALPRAMRVTCRLTRSATAASARLRAPRPTARRPCLSPAGDGGGRAARHRHSSAARQARQQASRAPAVGSREARLPGERPWLVGRLAAFTLEERSASVAASGGVPVTSRRRWPWKGYRTWT